MARRNEANTILGDAACDEDLRAIAQEDLIEAETLTQQLELELIKALVEVDPNDKRNAIIEITAGVGGDEACIFAGELYRMYERYSKNNNWTIDDLDFSGSLKGGLKSVTFKVIGAGVYGKLRYESGIHRVQRFSATASVDIMHTSAAAVVVLPEITRTESSVKACDVREDNFATGGPGGQNQNKSCTGVRLTHEPTGIVASIRENKSQLRNRERAWEVLTARIADYYAQQVDQKNDETRRNLRGKGSRCEKIRTYNYPQGRVTDHRIDFSVHDLPGLLNGNLDTMIKKLKDYDDAVLG